MVISSSTSVVSKIQIDLPVVKDGSRKIVWMGRSAAGKEYANLIEDPRETIVHYHSTKYIAQFQDSNAIWGDWGLGKYQT